MPSSETPRLRRTNWLTRASDAETVLAAVVDSVGCGVLLFGPAGELRGVNDAFGRMLQIARHDLDDVADFRALASRLAPYLADSEAAVSRWHQCFERDKACWDELELVHPERRILERYARPVLEVDGRRLGWIEIYRDVTSRKLLDAKLFHTDRVLALGQMVSGVAHELNNPLTSILGYAQILASHHAGTERQEEALRILQEAERASRIAKNLLLFARETKHERTPIDLNEIVERTLELRAYQLRLENIAVVLDLDPTLGPTMADATHLQQVFLNLLLNAEQALVQSGAQGRIGVRTHRLFSGRATIEVSDNGPGVPPEIAPRIFDPFFTTKPPGVGTGLGLSIVRGIAHEHGGEVSVRPRPGGGAIFTVELPMSAGPAVAPSAKLWPHAEPSGLTAAESQAGIERRRQRILVVEDEPTVAQFIVDVLEEEGHPVETALDSRNALALIARTTYDLVICDLRMPHLDGRGFYRELVRQRSRLDRRLIFVTGDTLAPHTLAFLEGNGLPYLAKPFLVEELKEAVRNAIALARERETNASAQALDLSARPVRTATSKR